MDQHNLLYPPIHLDDVKEKNQVLYMKSGSLVDVALSIFDVNRQVHEYTDVMSTEEIPAFLDSDCCSNLKAAFLNVGDVKCLDRPKSDEFRQMVSEEFRKHRIPFYVGSEEVFISTSILVAAKMESKPKETVLGLYFRPNLVSVYELYRESGGYTRIDRRFVRNSRLKLALKTGGFSLTAVKSEMLGQSDPKCVIISHSNGANQALIDRIIQLFRPKKIIEVELKDEKLVAALTKNMFDPSFNYFHVVSVCEDSLAVTKKDHDIGEQDSVISAKQYYTKLPFEKSEIVPNSSMPFYVVRWPTCSHDEPNNCEFVTKFEPVIGKRYRTKLTLIIDKNGFSYLYQQPYPQVETLLQTLTSQHDFNVPVIGFFDNSSVICARDENGYSFLESWNGMSGKDLFISFEQEMPQLVSGNDDINRKNSFMVYDLVKILSMGFDRIEINPEWGFKVISDAKNQVFIKFDNFDGKRKSMTPVSLLSLLLEHHIEAINAATGKKPTELGFYIFEKIDQNGKKRLEKRFKEACRLLEIGYAFVYNI